MKVLAVIPARAGSKGIPNKNLRLINNHPLIYYAINNAKSSKYITDIVVSTDSPVVEAIAIQMGVNVRLRRPELSGDSVTLDAVIYDAAKNYTADYVISMQPTSPTLTPQTLDNAIEYAVRHDTDTLISAINKPHLAWLKDGDRKLPAYRERLNRQYLPPYYMETGAFFISKGSVVTPFSRFGAKCDIYEIPENEAIDIDTFGDLKYAEAVLERKRTAIYVNGNTLRGMGHIYRALELADEFYSKPDIYYDINQTDRKLFGSTTHTLIPVNGIDELLSIAEKEQYDLFINDILSTSIDYMTSLRNAIPNAKIINFEDDGEGIYKADLVINALFHEAYVPHMMSGEQYYISPKLYMFYGPIKIKERVKKVFISFGGSDPQNYSERLLNIISDREYNDISFTVVLGLAKDNADRLMNFNDYPNIEVLFNVKNMPHIMAECDMAITSRGRTCYELAILGIPAIAMAQNHREEKHGFVCSDNGFTYLGLNPADETIKANLDMYIHMGRAERLRFQALLLSHDLKNGRRKVMNLINNL